jgi:hypothetical protein
MAFNSTRTRVGEIRPSQLLRDFGVGALIDLPNISAVVLGLEDWESYYQQAQEISEERLLTFVRWWLGQQVARLRTPPVPVDSDLEGAPGLGSPVGVPIAAFPRWMVCSYCRALAPVESGLFQLKPQSYRPERTMYVHTNCSKPGAAPSVQPARFLVACKRGHLDDFPWLYYVHRGDACEAPRLTLRETGFSSNITEVRVTCEACGVSRAMSDAFGDTAKKVMPLCRGRRPHLRDFEDDGCDEQMSTLLLGASNTWFPVLLRALSIPKAADPLANLVDFYWPQLSKATSEQNVDLMLSLGVLPHMTQYKASDIWRVIEARQSGQAAKNNEEVTDLKAPEWQVFSRGVDILDHPYFHIRTVATPPKFNHALERVVLVERLREVDALVGFTRLASLGDLAEESDATDTTHPPFVSLSRKKSSWVPAFEIHGEGIFLRFREEAITNWLERTTLEQREKAFHKAHTGWRARRHIVPYDAHFPGLRYVLLHSFAHALMRQLSLEAGYSMASLCERIYARNSEDPGGPMAGILLYTAAPDSEGTLGGLVSLGAPERLTDHIHSALESIRWCASDPLCASHEPNGDGDRLYGAACHACLFAPETSCERGNRYLDRSLLLPTMEHRDMAFFSEL